MTYSSFPKSERIETKQRIKRCFSRGDILSANTITYYLGTPLQGGPEGGATGRSSTLPDRGCPTGQTSPHGFHDSGGSGSEAAPRLLRRGSGLPPVPLRNGRASAVPFVRFALSLLLTPLDSPLLHSNILREVKPQVRALWGSPVFGHRVPLVDNDSHLEPPATKGWGVMMDGGRGRELTPGGSR